MPPFRHSTRVRYNECDAQQAVFNANYLVFCDVAITELWREAMGSYDKMAQDLGIDLVVAEANVKYRKATRFDEVLDVDVTIERLGNTAMTTRFDMSVDGEMRAQGHLRHVFVTIAGGAKTPIPDEVRAVLEPYVGLASDGQ